MNRGGVSLAIILLELRRVRLQSNLTNIDFGSVNPCHIRAIESRIEHCKMSFSFWINIAIALGSLSGAWLDHGETLAALKTAAGAERRRKLAKLVLLWGVPVLSIAALPITAWEGATSEQLLHEVQVTATNAIAKADATHPRKQSIVSASARVKLLVIGTNATPINPVKDKEFVCVAFGPSEQANSNIWAIRLECTAFTKFPQGDKTRYFIEFGMNQLAPLWNLGNQSLVERIDEWNAVLVQAFFLQQDTEILEGDAILTLNSTVSKSFPISRQKATYENHRFQMAGTNTVSATVKVVGSF